jgi:hypothetical protein
MAVRTSQGSWYGSLPRFPGNSSAAILKLEGAKMSANTTKKASKSLHRGKKLGAVKPLKKPPQGYLKADLNEVYITSVAPSGS